jgi:GrpB-like predicted nucleotidyltransferase (UPF0157 family)
MEDSVRQFTTKARLDACTIGGARPHRGPIHLAEYDEAWPQIYAGEADNIRRVLGAAVMRLEHVGSTSVAGLAAKPIIDMVLEVADSANEENYVAPLELCGYQLRIREPDWFEHRMFKGPAADINLHVFSDGCPEIDRMVAFRDHLRSSDEDRVLYETKKRELAVRSWKFIQHYADAKSAIVREILARAVATRS